ncbi:MAG TPA: phenylalanine--tRNA ligase subunit beta, partial [Polyangiaceae bacterium]|nr:phenylalanine--tRNA ligase subunit beta [Polyangiaceae bacterium]
MKASVRWLRELCPQLPADPAVLAERLTRAGLEIESVEPFGRGAEACQVAAVVSTRPHPSRTGLRLVTVDAGGAPQEVVCGAPNVPEAGALVVFAPLGAHLPAKAMTIERRVIAGVPSEGMLCSEAELGLGGDESGILVLPAGIANPGTPLPTALPFALDTVLEIGVTPNRPDALGHVGLAREAAALLGAPFALPRPESPERARDDAVANQVAVSIEDGDRCPHYGASLLVDASVGPSPLAVRWRLSALGVRSISNVVDVTNWVMLEFGHPLHAFDLDKVRGSKIVVRRARAGEVLRTLDGLDRILDEDDLVICDGHGPVALAGVMGGGESEITPATRRVLLECAYFEPRGVRRAARRHALHTESSHRFERGVDWADTRLALERACAMVSKLAGATAVGRAHLVEARPLTRATVSMRQERLCGLLGDEVPAAEARGILERLGFIASHAADRWEVPSFRPDATREVDLIEEVARVRGYDVIPARLPAVAPTRAAAPRESLARDARDAAVALGLSEAIAFSFVSP